MKVALHSLFVLSFSLFGAELKVVKIDEIHIRGELGSHESSWLAYILDQDGHDVVEIGGQLKSGTIFTGKAVSYWSIGQKKKEENRKVNELMSAVVWKPNGEKCLETNLKDGKGVYVEYKEDGTVRYKSKTKSPPAQTR